MSPNEVLEILLKEIPKDMWNKCTVYFVMDMRDCKQNIHLMNVWIRCNDQRDEIYRTFLVEYKKNIYPSYLDPVEWSEKLKSGLEELRGSNGKV